MIQSSYNRVYCVLLLGKTIYFITACLQTPFPDFSEWWQWLTRVTFEFPFSTKLFSGSRRNFEEGCQDIRQLLGTSHPGERQFMSPHDENVVHLALEVMQCVQCRISLLNQWRDFFYCYCWRIFALEIHARTTAPASRDLQGNGIDVYVCLDLLATIVIKVSLKMIEMNFLSDFNTVVYFFIGSRFRIVCVYDTLNMTHCGGKEGLGHNFRFHALFLNSG